MFKKKVPIYEQIKSIIIDNILSGVWKEGDKIPSIRNFALEFGVNPNTIMNALKDLQQKKILENKRGIGNIVCDGVVEKILRDKKEKFCNEKLNEVIKEAKILKINLNELKDEIESKW
ncbi:GntR family transcriptional regulator [Haliovirga abyssi]|uniref:GntR family transcriptional regulator n=1 Tax=Haliovirga abyssi TaxID=2996794 RepID=A0AAU9E320_9FUSO|nr:GntR family transcriptional regulator [Haliovirga abyssi]BDU50820.1 GntR family transcriptional regulator [Haliovirga abyssi]